MVDQADDGVLLTIAWTMAHILELIARFDEVLFDGDMRTGDPCRQEWLVAIHEGVPLSGAFGRAAPLVMTSLPVWSRCRYRSISVKRQRVVGESIRSMTGIPK
jgi:hypothetical protein